ncbi:MAG: class I SAM-dependent methyltransferase [Chroococcales cyanobacterium]
MKSWYQDNQWFQQGLENQKTWYSNVADAYFQARPHYSTDVIHRVTQFAQLKKNARILEIGCGPGIATLPFAELGFEMVSLEPSLEACQLARENCSEYPNVTVLDTTFEEWPGETKKFDAILAATSFHWISREKGYPKILNLLKDKGYLILLWNTPPQVSYETFQRLDPVYQTHAPSLARYDSRKTHEKNLKAFGEQIIDGRQFQELIFEPKVCQVTYSIDQYLMLLTTLSPYIALEPKTRHSLLKALREVLEKNGENFLELSYISAFHVAEKVAD